VEHKGEHTLPLEIDRSLSQFIRLAGKSKLLRRTTSEYGGFACLKVPFSRPSM
jgi:hypothetical protein